jgi:hypothetical protein
MLWKFIAAQEGKRMVVMGSSFISMELVAAVAGRKLESIDVIGREEFPFESVLGKEVGQGLQKVATLTLRLLIRPHLSRSQYHESQGVKFHMKSEVEKIIPSESNPSLAIAVVVNGQTVPADFVIMGVGVTPATEFLTQSGFQLEKDGGIRVDEYLKVQGCDNIYAIGALGHVFCRCPCRCLLQVISLFTLNKGRERAVG